MIWPDMAGWFIVQEGEDALVEVMTNVVFEQGRRVPLEALKLSGAAIAISTTLHAGLPFMASGMTEAIEERWTC